MIEQIYPSTDHSGDRREALVIQVSWTSILGEYDRSLEENENRSLPPASTPVVVTFVKDEKIYSFESTIHGFAEHQGATAIVLRRPKRVVKVQRRFSYRVPVSTRTTYRVLTQGSFYGLPLPATIVNLSEGGLLITTEGWLVPGQYLSIGIPSGVDGETMLVVAKVLQVLSNEPGRQEIYNARLRFEGPNDIGLSDRERDQLAKYLFEQQRLMLQTRRLLNPPRKR